MKYWMVALLMLAIILPVNAQNENAFVLVDAKARQLPDAVTQSTYNLAAYIQKQFTGSKDRIRAAYRWVTANIEYDKDSMLAINWSKNAREKIAATLRRKKGVCDNFASVFSDILVKMNIPSYVVNGTTRADGANNTPAHSWCAVYYNNGWLLCDPTWDAAYINQPQFFLIDPTQFIYTHWPFDPLWQLLPYPITLKEFERGYTNAQKDKTYFNVNDSIASFLALDSLQQLESIARRMKASGLDGETLRVWYAFNQMNLAIIYGENDMYLYNAAVADLNNASAYLNRFIQYRNNLFIPLQPDSVIKDMLQPVNGFLQSALKKTAAMGLIKENFQYDTGPLKDRLKSLGDRLDEQNKFLKHYLSTPPVEREKLFYN